MRSSFASLLVLVPLACLPLLCGNLHAWIIEGGTRLDASPYVEIYSLVFGLACLWIGWRGGLRAVGPQSAPASRLAGVPGAASTIWAMPSARASAIPAMVWQFAAQNVWLLSGLALLLLFASLGAVLFVITPASPAASPSLGLGAGLAALLACSWLGLLVFQSDSLDRRSLFLADRGIQPWKVWCTRQLIPLAIVACAWLIALFAMRTSGQLAMYGLGFVFVSYLCSQWIGQMIDSPIVSAIVAPLLSLGSIAYLGYAQLQLFAPMWTLGLSGLIALGATCMMTRSWMDRHKGWRFWLFHAACIVLAALIPASSFLVFAASYPRLTRDLRAELQAIAGTVRQDSRPPLRMGLPDSGQPSEDRDEEDEQTAAQSPATQPAGSPDETLSWEARQALRLQSIQDQSAAQPQALPDNGVLRSLLAETLLLRMHCEQDSTPERLANYRRCISLTTEFVRRHRASWRLFDQDQADLLEIWLWEELQQPQAAEWMGAEVYAEAREMLRAKASRDQARRRAIALSWKNAAPNELGGYSLEHSATPKELFIAKRKADLISGLLLRLLKATPEQSKSLRSEIGMLINERPQLSGDQIVYMSTADGARDILYAEIESLYALATHWNGHWERAAAQPE